MPPTRPNPINFYQASSTADIGNGDLYGLVPVIWLEQPPIEILREEGTELLFGNEANTPQAFSLAAADGVESVKAQAKKRTVVIVSPDLQNQRPGFPRALVLPLFSLDRFSPALQDAVRRDAVMNYFFMPQAPNILPRDFAGDFSKIAPVEKTFLIRKVATLTAPAVAFLKFRLAGYLL